jgi:hypothetical protein
MRQLRSRSDHPAKERQRPRRRGHDDERRRARLASARRDEVDDLAVLESALIVLGEDELAVGDDVELRARARCRRRRDVERLGDLGETAARV